MKKQQNQRALSNAGFSLLEVILSMAILAILSIPLLSYFTQSMKYNAKMADKQHASNLAQEVMENLKNQPNLVQNADASGFDVPYLEAENYVKASYTPAAPGPTETGGSVDYYGQADAIGEKYDIRVSVSTNQAENLSKMPNFWWHGARTLKPPTAKNSAPASPPAIMMLSSLGIVSLSAFHCPLSGRSASFRSKFMRL